MRGEPDHFTSEVQIQERTPDPKNRVDSRRHLSILSRQQRATTSTQDTGITFDSTYLNCWCFVRMSVAHSQERLLPCTRRYCCVVREVWYRRSCHLRGGKPFVGNYLNNFRRFPILSNGRKRASARAALAAQLCCCCSTPNPSPTRTLRQRWLLERNRWVNLLLREVAIRQAE